MGMAVYLGRRGLASYERIQEANIDDPLLPPFAAFEQKCLMVSFNDREELDSQGLKQIKDLGLRFRGKGKWPAFWDYSPGLVPWPLEREDQIRFLSLAIEQAMEVAKRCQLDQDFLDHVEGAAPCLLVRRQEEDGHWKDRWMRVGPYQPQHPAVRINQLYLRSNCRDLPTQARTWLADVFYFPNPVQEEPDQRPYMPVMLIIIDYSSGIIIGHGAYRPGELEEKLQEVLVQTIKEAAYLPERVVMPGLEAMAYFRPLVEELDIQLEREENPSLLDEIKLSLFGSMSL